MANQKKLIAVIGSGECTPEEAQIAERVGRELAWRGITLICGGLCGVMEAACRGAQSEGGDTIGILPGDISNTANPYVTIPILTGLGTARNAIVAKSGQAVIAIGGNYGTLTEIAFALQNHIPVIGLNTWGLSQKGQPDNSIVIASDPVDAVNKAISLSGGE
jgi:uncharacterized protein (TIGR00725 family)